MLTDKATIRKSKIKTLLRDALGAMFNHQFRRSVGGQETGFRETLETYKEYFTKGTNCNPFAVSTSVFFISDVPYRKVLQSINPDYAPMDLPSMKQRLDDGEPVLFYSPSSIDGSHSKHTSVLCCVAA